MVNKTSYMHVQNYIFLNLLYKLFLIQTKTRDFDKFVEGNTFTTSYHKLLISNGNKNFFVQTTKSSKISFFAFYTNDNSSPPPSIYTVHTSNTSNQHLVLVAGILNCLLLSFPDFPFSCPKCVWGDTLWVLSLWFFDL